jgi:hypothetical protein|tara:strand:- start:232 stop:369 length:138 start_codon:yes stop_codon:yes gene_type:complete
MSQVGTKGMNEGYKGLRGLFVGYYFHSHISLLFYSIEKILAEEWE